MPNSKKTIVQQTNNRNMTKNKAKASAKSNELHPHAQSQSNAAHLLFPQRTLKQLDSNNA